MRDPDCVFCKIVAEEIPSVKVYEDEYALAFLDIAPLVEGHALVVPRNHTERIEHLSDTDNQKIWEMVRIMVPRLQEAMGAQGMTVAVNDGRAAGQEVPHVHVHLVPRTKKDEFGPIHDLFQGRRPEVTHADLASIANRIRSV